MGNGVTYREGMARAKVLATIVVGAAVGWSAGLTHLPIIGISAKLWRLRALASPIKPTKKIHGLSAAALPPRAAAAAAAAAAACLPADHVRYTISSILQIMSAKND